jgi:hypothetical protein
MSGLWQAVALQGVCLCLGAAWAVWALRGVWARSREQGARSMEQGAGRKEIGERRRVREVIARAHQAGCCNPFGRRQTHGL